MEILHFVSRLESWYWSIFFAILLFCFRWYFEKKLLKIIKKYVMLTENKYDDFVIFALEPPVCLALYVSIFYVAAINAPIHLVGLFEWLVKALRLTLLFSLFWGFYRLFLPKNQETGDQGIVYRFIDDIVEQNDTAYANMISIGFRIVICIVAFGIFTNELGYDLSAFIASLSIGTAAILYASKDAFSNVISSVIILLDKPFKEDEWIKTNDIEGIVEEISFRSTKIRTFANEEVYIPSSLLVNAPIVNVSRCGKRRIKFNLAISMDTTEDQLRKLIFDIKNFLNNNPTLTHEPEDVRVNFTEFHYVCYKIEIICFMAGFDQIKYLNISNVINLEIVKILQDNKVQLAFQGEQARSAEPINILDFCDDVLK
ncbi:MAG: mechanosensitive ion channel family protein [Phascolarctobacterium sp.]|uniref:mechanosensitive ion channel family protein n=1 Tax=Phascolarctobacterium sp. TaxID=2049039 RepID=UPI0026DCF1CF|nr:mechanosensitive ion channel family protein [Phascolarctobacterium sp.]MDO4921768.1 mechanosensitive ion channel family protein [Phascolarctobacterium sp.]